MEQWVRLCGKAEIPAPGSAAQYEVAGVDVCLVNENGALAAVNNWCPHRQGPLAEGWLEDGKIVCPWHAWGFDLKTGECPEENSRVAVYPVKEEADDLLVQLDSTNLRAAVASGASGC